MTEFHFRHILQDGTVLKPGDKFPDTPRRREVFGRVVALIKKISAKEIPQGSDSKKDEGVKPA